jgi:hypothetical protein
MARPRTVAPDWSLRSGQLKRCLGPETAPVVSSSYAVDEGHAKKRKAADKAPEAMTTPH